MTRRFVFLLLGIAFFASACTSEGLPASYDDQENRAEKQFVAACEAALEGEDADAPAICQCAFYTVSADLTFEEFLELDERLKDDPEALALEDRQLLTGVSLPCEFSAEDRNDS